MAQALIKNGVVRTATTDKRVNKLKLQGYTDFKPGKPKPTPKPTTETK